MTHEQLLAHSEFLRRVARNLVGDDAAADDFVQATYLTAIEHPPRNHRAGRGWLKTVFLNLVRSEKRREALRGSCDLPRPAEAALEPFDIVAREQTIRRMIDAVMALPTAYRVVIVMKFYDGLNPAEIGRDLGIPVETVRTRQRRALAQLRRNLDREYDGHRSAWLMALAPFAGYRMAPAASLMAAPVALVLGSAKVVALVAVAVLLCVAVVVLNRDDTSDFVSDPGGQAEHVDRARGPERNALPVSTQPPTGIEESAAAKKPEPDASESALDAPDLTDILVTVHGRAVDVDGNPVIGADIELVSTNGARRRLASTVSGEGGYFAFDEKVVPPQAPKKDFGTVLIYGSATGYGFSWHGMRFINRGLRTEKMPEAGEGDTYYRNDICVMNLVFPKSQSVEGIVVDENDRPVGDVEVSLASCDYIDTEGKHTHVNFREFWGISDLPEYRRKTRSDSRGRFRIRELPREMLLHFWLRHPERATKSVFVVTTDRDSADLKLKPNVVGAKGAIFEKSPVRVVMPSTRRISVRCTHPWNDAPIAGARLSAYRREGERLSSNGKSDAQGELVLHLPVGKFRVCVDPPKGSELVRTYSEFDVTETPLEQSFVVKIDVATVVIFEAVDAVTKKPIAGVSFSHTDAQGRTRGINSSPSIVDHPKTDAEGRMRVLMNPGKLTVFPGGYGALPGYRRPQEPLRLDLEPGDTKTVRVEFQPK